MYFRRIPGPQSPTVLDLRTPDSRKCEAVPRRARIEGAKTFVLLDSRLERDKEEYPTGENKRLEGALSTAETAGVTLRVVEGEVQAVQALLATSREESTLLQVHLTERIY